MTPDSFPLVIDDPTVLFTNATITPFKSMFTGETEFSDFALVQKCLRLGGTGGTIETARSDMNYSSLFDMLGSGFFEVSHDDAMRYFVEMLDAIGLEKEKLLFSTIGAYALESSLKSVGLEDTQIRIFEDPKELQHEWSFGEGDLHGRGVIAWVAPEGHEQEPALSDCLQIGRIVDIDGISEKGAVKPFEYTAFDVGLGMGRVELALTGETEFSTAALRKLSTQFKNSFESISDGDAHYMANLGCVVDELTGEGLMPGNKKHSYVLRKVIRSLIEEVWMQSGGLVSASDALSGFTKEAIDPTKASEAVSNEEDALRRVLSEAAAKRRKHPNMTPEELRATFGIKPSLAELI